MNPSSVNKIRDIWCVNSLLEMCCDLLVENNLYKTIFSDYGEGLRKKLEFFGVSMSFNFKLWKNLHENKQLFNYLKMSTFETSKNKWMNIILQLIPDLELIFNETHNVFDFYKNILLGETKK